MFAVSSDISFGFLGILAHHGVGEQRNKTQKSRQSRAALSANESFTSG